MEVLDLIEPSDLDILVEEDSDNSLSDTVEKSLKNKSAESSVKELSKDEMEELQVSDKQDVDDLESLKEDLDESLLSDQIDKDLDTPNSVLSGVELLEEEEKRTQKELVNEAKKVGKKKAVLAIFDIGHEEKELLEMAKFIEGKIPDSEWEEISGTSAVNTYVVQSGEWLWKISEKLFGSGFYYSKIWAMNSYITNPHEITPGMTLSFVAGDSSNPPEIRVGKFLSDSEQKNLLNKELYAKEVFNNFAVFGNEAEPSWIKERKRLIEQGVFIQYDSENTYDDLARATTKILNREHEKYVPPYSEVRIDSSEVKAEYGSGGFSKNSKIMYDVKEGFYLHTFISTNVIQDLGFLHSGKAYNTFFVKTNIVYLDFDPMVNVAPGDKFSIYSVGKVTAHHLSDREGRRYTIVGHVEVRKKVDKNLWEAEVIKVNEIMNRADRITVYTPSLDKIIRTYNPRKIEALIMDGYISAAGVGYSVESIVYLDRGRVDGVEMGNIFNVYGFVDNNTEKRITLDPTYKIGEMVVITLTDNFATALISSASAPIQKGSIAITQSAEERARSQRLARKSNLSDIEMVEGRALEELDVELNLDAVDEELLKKAEKIKLSEDELEELERIEREKSVIKGQEKDLYELERLEKEIESAESQLREAKLDEDKFLETQSLNKLEKELKKHDPNAFGALDDIEKEVGRKYMDEDLNSKENPYGLTEYDIEEIDELLNTSSLDKKR